MIDIKEIIWTNFLGYGDYKNSISFDDIKGICLIEGEIDGNDTRPEGDEKLNAAGKTSIIEAITWCLFGSLTRIENPGDAVINWHTGKNCMVSIKTRDGYEITRMRKYNGLTEIVIFKDGEDITRSTSAPAQEFINKTFGIEYHTFSRSRIFGQFSSGFLELSDQKIRKVMESLMGIDDMTPIVKTAKSKIDKIDNDIILLNNKIDNLNGEIDKIHRHIDYLNDKSSNFDIEINDEILDIKNDIEQRNKEMLSKIDDIKNDINEKLKEKESKSIIDIDQLDTEWNNYNNKLNEYEKEFKNQSIIKSELTQAKYELKSKSDSIKNIDSLEEIDIDIVKKNIQERNDKEIQLSKYNDLKIKLIMIITELNTKKLQEDEFISKDHGSVCPECRSELNGDRLNEIKDKCKHLISDYYNKIIDGNEKLAKLKNAISNIEESLQNKITTIDEAELHNQKVKKQRNEIKLVETDINKLSLEIERLSSLIIELDEPLEPSISISEAQMNNDYINNISSAINNCKNRIQELKNNFKEEVSKANAKIIKLKKKENPYDDMIREQRISIRDIEEQKVLSEKAKNEKKTIKAHLDYIKESYNNKRKIKAFWIGELIPDFNKYLRYYLDFFEVNDKIEFDELLSPKMDRWGYTTHSGGECKRIDLSIMFALSDLHTANFGPQSNFMILDEVDGRVDPFTINKLVSLLSDDMINRKDGLTNIFVISHRDEMKDRFPNKIKVKNKQERSYLVYDG